MTRAILPGSYDPVTEGHLDVIRRAAKEYDEIYVVIFKNPDKVCRFSLDDRVRMLLLATDGIENAIVSSSDGLVIDYAIDHEIGTIVKGVRSEKDAAYEKPMAEWNLAHGGIPTVFYTASPAFSGISSTLAREKLDTGATLDGILPPAVIEYIRDLEK